MHRTSRRIVAFLLPTLVSAAVLPAAAAGQSLAQAGGAAVADAAPSPHEAGRPPYKVLATRRASTLEQELNGGAAEGYRLHSITWKRQLYGTFLFPFPGDRNEVTALTMLDGRPGRFRYRVLRGLSEADLETALNEAAQEGFRVRSVGKFIVLERDDAGTSARREYEVVTTSKVTTLEAELRAMRDDGYAPVGLLPPRGAVEGLVAILSRPARNVGPPAATAP